MVLDNAGGWSTNFTHNLYTVAYEKSIDTYQVLLSAKFGGAPADRISFYFTVNTANLGIDNASFRTDGAAQTGAQTIRWLVNDGLGQYDSYRKGRAEKDPSEFWYKVR